MTNNRGPRWVQLVLNLGCLALIAAAAVSRVGWLSGLAITATVYLLMPWAPRGQS